MSLVTLRTLLHHSYGSRLLANSRESSPSLLWLPRQGIRAVSVEQITRSLSPSAAENTEVVQIPNVFRESVRANADPIVRMYRTGGNFGRRARSSNDRTASPPLLLWELQAECVFSATLRPAPAILRRTLSLGRNGAPEDLTTYRPPFTSLFRSTTGFSHPFLAFFKRAQEDATIVSSL